MTEAFLVKGLGGKRELQGTIRVAGAKNAALQALAFSVLFAGTVQYENIPEIEDTRRMLEILKLLGVSVEIGDHTATLTCGDTLSSIISEEHAKRMRASVILTGPILARTGEVRFPHPGGCVIGKRPVDIFIDSYRKMGAEVEETDTEFIVRVPDKKGTRTLRGADIFMRVVSVTATQTLMMAAVLADGTTTLRNAALEPETVSLADYLNACGAQISGAGTSTIVITGTGLLSANGRVYQVPPDRIEAGSFAILGALAARELIIDKCNPREVQAVIETLRQAGVHIETNENQIIVKNKKEAHAFTTVDIKTHEYPGFPTDCQAPMVVFLTQATGESLVFETIFEGRLNYTEGLVRMGANIKMWDSNRATVKGPEELHGKELEGPDIRAGIAYVIAGIVAKGETTIHNAYYVDRGYERIEERLRGIGADIERITV